MIAMIRNLVFGVVVLGTVPIFAQSNIGLSALNANQGQSSLYKIEFSVDSLLDARAIISVEFPQKFDLSTVKIAGSNEITGGFSFLVDSTTLRLERSGLGSAIAANRRVSAIFGPIGNPGVFANDDSVKVVFEMNGRKTKPVAAVIRYGSNQ